MEATSQIDYRPEVCGGLGGGNLESIPEWPPELQRATVPLRIKNSFQLYTACDGSHVTWPSDRGQWHRFMRFVSELRVLPDGWTGLQPPLTSLLEITLS